MNSHPSTGSLASEEQERESRERRDDFEEGEEEEDDNENENENENEEDDEDDQEGDDAEGEEADGADNVGSSEIEKFARASASGSDKPLEEFAVQFAIDGTVGKKRERSNAKAVKCLDMDGNMLEVFRSGMAASMKLGIPQGDISLCCRGLKPSVMGYKFRFFGETEEKQAQRLKKGFVLEGVGMDNGNKVEMTRTTRASRGEYGQGRNPYDIPSRSLLDPPELKVKNCSDY